MSSLLTRARTPASPHIWRLDPQWPDEGPGDGLVEALLSLFGRKALQVSVATDTPQPRPVPASKALHAFRRTRAPIRIDLQGLSIEVSAHDAAITLTAGPLTDLPTPPVWFQADPSLKSPLPVIALPLVPDGLHVGTLDALLALANACSPVDTALLSSSSAALQLHPHTPAADSARSALSPAPADLVEELRASLPALETTAAVLTRATGLPVRLTQGAIDATASHLPPPADAILGLLPRADHILITLSPTLPAERSVHALAHAAAHLRLGHLRPGDPHGHWDTWATITHPHRRWDRETLAALPLWGPPIVQPRASLDACTPLEKAWLVLLGHIDAMVGQARTLHPAASDYQAAAYQRQAAQRLVAQLEDYGGAMLCDGVGLGKTYVATTVLVHYANAWRDLLASSGRPLSEDPLRVTILAPNSVVSTWEREAIPPLARHGVPIANVRVVSHTKLSRILPTSDVLTPRGHDPSDMAHLLLSDLVIVDEAHNFRSVAARRTSVLRDLLRLQPRKDLRRKVLLLTATPVNNSLEDLRQQASLLFAKPLWFNDNLTQAGYRDRVARDVEERLERARASRGGDVAATLIHGTPEARFSLGIDFRDDLQFGVQVPRVGDYLKEQEKLLLRQQELVRVAMLDAEGSPRPQTRVAAELLDRIVVQRSRELCKQIEREQGSDIQLLFRPDAPPPEKLVYEDVYDDTRDVLARFLPLFETGAPADAAPSALSLKVYMWSDVRDGVREASETSSVVGLQRVLVLKRLESTPVAFLITLLRLVALHAHRLRQLLDLTRDLGDRLRADALRAELDRSLAGLDPVSQERLDLLLTGEGGTASPRDLLVRWSEAHIGARPAAGADDPAPPQLELFERDDAETLARREQLDRLWDLKDDLTRDFSILLGVAPGLADIVFGRFERTDWPRRFIAGGVHVDWPASPTWGMRIVTDAKLRRLVSRLLSARRSAQKAIVFSQFTDTLAYIDSVLRATHHLGRNEWRLALRTLSDDVGAPIAEEDVRALAERTIVVSGETEDRDAAINAFAPFYRLGPAPRTTGLYLFPNQDPWAQGWLRAMDAPIDVLLASDVLAEGVNLQDASLLVNYDVHWNPVRMIQRAGRVDRRLNPAVEEATSFPELERLAAAHGKAAPRYWWHDHPHASPVTVNLLLPDELEAELQLRERIANKTLAIDFTLGLEQGTGAEAEWMADYRYQGISALNVWQKDRAIERVASYQERLRRLLAERSIDSAWVHAWNGWLRESGVEADARVLAWARLGRKGGELAEYTRHLTPKVDRGVAHWLWTTARPAQSLLNAWLSLDGKTFPAQTRTDLGFSDDASRPLSADDLLAAALRLVDADGVQLDELGREIGRPVMQGASAIAAGFLGTDADRRAIQVKGFRILQLALDRAGPADPSPVPRRGLARTCASCDHPPGMHKCCPACGATASGEAAVEATFGFRRMRAADGTPYEVPQPWCRVCRTTHRPTPLLPQEELPC